MLQGSPWLQPSEALSAAHSLCISSPWAGRAFRMFLLNRGWRISECCREQNPAGLGAQGQPCLGRHSPAPCPATGWVSPEISPKICPGRDSWRQEITATQRAAFPLPWPACLSALDDLSAQRRIISEPPLAKKHKPYQMESESILQISSLDHGSGGKQVT